MDPVRDHVELERLTSRIVLPDRVSATERSIAVATEHEHDVLTWLRGELVEAGARQPKPPHPRAQVAGLGHLQLQRPYAIDRQQARGQRKRVSLVGLRRVHLDREGIASA
jgi:hypothetical protein